MAGEEEEVGGVIEGEWVAVSEEAYAVGESLAVDAGLEVVEVGAFAGEEESEFGVGVFPACGEVDEPVAVFGVVEASDVCGDAVVGVEGEGVSGGESEFVGGERPLFGDDAVGDEGDFFERDACFAAGPVEGFGGGDVDVVAEVGEPASSPGEGDVGEVECVEDGKIMSGELEAACDECGASVVAVDDVGGVFAEVFSEDGDGAGEVEDVSLEGRVDPLDGAVLEEPVPGTAFACDGDFVSVGDHGDGEVVDVAGEASGVGAGGEVEDAKFVTHGLVPVE